MKYKLTNRSALAALLGVLTSTGAIAAEPLGLYIGAGAGKASVTGEQGFDEKDTGWTAFAGLRPLPNLGIELQHVEFGHARGSHGPLDQDGSARTTAVFGMGVLPLPSVDLYAKVGLGVLQQTTTSLQMYNLCAVEPTPPSCQPVRHSTTGANFGWGLGAQFKWSSLAVRGEFVQFVSNDHGNPDLLSLSLLWRF